MPATYFRHRQGRSIAGRQAVKSGRLTLTASIAAVRKQAPRRGAWSRGMIVQALCKTHDGEWHHTGKFAAQCEYYLWSRAIGFLRTMDKFRGMSASEAHRLALRDNARLEFMEPRFYRGTKIAGGYYADCTRWRGSLAYIESCLKDAILSPHDSLGFPYEEQDSEYLNRKNDEYIEEIQRVRIANRQAIYNHLFRG